MIKIEGHIEDKYWIIMNGDNSVIHYGLVTVGNVVDSGLSSYEIFIIKQEWIDRLIELRIEFTEEELEGL
jgi:hypothetical protein